MPIEPITIYEVSQQVRTDVSDQQDKIDMFITAKRENCESATRRALVPKTKILTLSQFPGSLPIEIPTPPLRLIDSITYTDTDGVEQTLVEDTDFRVLLNVDEPVQPSHIAPLYGESWPTARTDIGSVQITYQCGYGVITIETVDVDVPIPVSLKQWLLLNVANLYEHRETVQIDNRLQVVNIPEIGDILLTDYRVSGW